jgi:hypothetical protein
MEINVQKRADEDVKHCFGAGCPLSFAFAFGRKQNPNLQLDSALYLRYLTIFL